MMFRKEFTDLSFITVVQPPPPSSAEDPLSRQVPSLLQNYRAFDRSRPRRFPRPVPPLKILSQHVCIDRPVEKRSNSPLFSDKIIILFRVLSRPTTSFGFGLLKVKARVEKGIASSNIPLPSPTRVRLVPFSRDRMKLFFTGIPKVPSRALDYPTSSFPLGS